MNPAATRILIADDDASIRLVLSQAFSRLGYQVRATGAAATLLKWEISEGAGDLVITDVVMPDENLFDILPRIRRQRPMLPIIVMSAQNTLLTAVAAAEMRRIRIPSQAVRSGRHDRCGAARTAIGLGSLTPPRPGCAPRAMSACRIFQIQPPFATDAGRSSPNHLRAWCGTDLTVLIQA